MLNAPLPGKVRASLSFVFGLFPSLKGQSGQVWMRHSRTSFLELAQQSRHFRRIAFTGVVRFSSSR